MPTPRVTILPEAIRGVKFARRLTTNMLERFNEEIKRLTYVLRIFPNAKSCFRLVRSLSVETHENWLEANRSLTMVDLKALKKTELRKAA